MSEAVDLKVLRRFKPFDTLADTHLNDIRRKIEAVQHPKGKILFRRDEVDARLHFLLDGSVDLADASFAITSIVADTDRAHESLDPSNPHAFTAICTTAVTTASLPKDFLDLVLTWDQAGNYMVSDLSAGELDGVELDWMSSLLQSAMFAQVPPANIQKLFSRFTEVVAKKGDVVVGQGESGDFFYVVKTGRAHIVRRMTVEGQIKELTLAELRPGDVFGEDALIGDAPRNASVVMAVDGSLMRLGKDDFHSLLQQPVLRYVDWAQYQSMMRDQGGPVELLDVRLPLEYRQGHIRGARNVPLHLLRGQLATLPQDAYYVTTCDGGRRSALAAYILNQHGFDAVVLKDVPAGLVSAA